MRFMSFSSDELKISSLARFAVGAASRCSPCDLKIHSLLVSRERYTFHRIHRLIRYQHATPAKKGKRILVILEALTVRCPRVQMNK
jgi:hypothetical protein